MASSRQRNRHFSVPISAASNAEVFWLIEVKGETGSGERRQPPVFTEARRHSFNELDLKINSKSEQTRVDGVDASFQRSGGRDVVEFEERRRRTKTVVYVGHATRRTCDTTDTRHDSRRRRSASRQRHSDVTTTAVPLSPSATTSLFYSDVKRHVFASPSRRKHSTFILDAIGSTEQIRFCFF